MNKDNKKQNIIERLFENSFFIRIILLLIMVPAGAAVFYCKQQGGSILWASLFEILSILTFSGTYSKKLLIREISKLAAIILLICFVFIVIIVGTSFGLMKL